jgi:PilZ domain
MRESDGCTALILRKHEFEIPVECLFDNDPEAIWASIRSVENGAFELCSPVPLKAGRQFLMRHPERTIESRVAYCKRQEEGTYSVGVLMARDADRRSEVRTPADIPAMLRVADSVAPIPVRVLDVSASGLGLELPTALSVGTFVQIELETGTVAGEIRHCAIASDKFRAGIRMREFVLHPNCRRVLFNANRETASVTPMEWLTRSIQERHSRYEAIFHSLAFSR